MRSSGPATTITSTTVAAFIVAHRHQDPKVLLLRRCSPTLFHNWQMISGKLEPGESAWQTAIREIREETGHVVTELYTLDILEQFYEWRQNRIHLIPVFVAFSEAEFIPKLAPSEHDAWQWASLDEAKNILEFRNQVESLKTIQEFFIDREPSPHLKIDL